jgi:molybdenum cofactor cytidylyltransferase
MPLELAIILAAGEGRRMGFPKALLELEPGQTALSRLVTLYRTYGSQVLAVIGAEAERVRRAHLGIAFELNPRWASGQLSSVQAGLRRALQDGAGWIWIHPVDAPLVRASTLAQLGARQQPVSLPTFEGLDGHPVRLSAEAAAMVLTSREPTLRAALGALSVVRVGVEDPAVVGNLNTPEDCLNVLGRPPLPLG